MATYTSRYILYSLSSCCSNALHFTCKAQKCLLPLNTYEKSQLFRRAFSYKYHKLCVSSLLLTVYMGSVLFAVSSAVFPRLLCQVHYRQPGVAHHQVSGVSWWLLSGPVWHEHVLQLSRYQRRTQPERVVLQELLYWWDLQNILSLLHPDNPLKGRGRVVSWLHLVSQVQPTFLISDIRALWHSGLSARVPECQKLKMQLM